MTRKVRIDALPESAYRQHERDAIVGIDVMLGATTIVTAVAQGRRAFAARNAQEARTLARSLEQPLLVHEGAERAPEGFDNQMGPAALSRRTDVARPLVLVSPWSGLLANTAEKATVYVACFRNLQATIETLAEEHSHVALLGAGFGGEQRCEDRIAAAWIARKLVERGFEAEDMTTVQEMTSWADADMSLVSWGKSADYLRRQKREDDLEFVLGHHDDLLLVCRYEGGEVFAVEGQVHLRRAVSGPVRMAYVSASDMAAGDTGRVRDNVVEFVRGARLGRKATS